MRLFQFITVIFLGALLLSGCKKEDCSDLVSARIFDFHGRMDVAETTNRIVSVSTLPSNAVLVAVNGCYLSKAEYDRAIQLKTLALLSKKGANQYVVSQQMDAFKQSYVKKFVGQRLMVDDAFQKCVVSTNEVLSHIEKVLRHAAEEKHVTVHQFYKSLGVSGPLYLYEAFTSYAMDRLITKRIPPKAEVNDEFVAAVQKQIEDDNRVASISNKMVRARLVDYKNQFMSNKLDFISVAATIEGVDPKKEGAGLWGEFEEGDLDDLKVRAAAFSMKVGEISDPIEDDNGYQLIKVVSVKPAERNEQGRIIKREVRVLSHIYVDKFPMLLRQTDVMLSADLKHQMRMQAVNEYITDLSTNGINRVVYPSGVLQY